MNVKRLTGFTVAALMAGSVGFAHAATVVGSTLAESTDAAVAGSAPAAVATTVSSTAAKLDPAALQAMLESRQQQFELINRILDKFQSEAGGQYSAGFDALDWRLAWGARLMYQPASVLASALATSNLAAAQIVLVAKTGGTLKHATDNNQTINYLATPCRIVDTRFGGGGLLGPVSRYWSASDTPAIIAAQGGAAAGCGIYPSANSFILNVTAIPTGAVGSGGANFLTVQHDSTVPTTATMIYYPGTIISNFATTTNFNGGGGGGFFAYATLSTHVAIDLVGWTGTPTPAAAAPLDCVVTASLATIIAAAATFNLPATACPAGYNAVATNCRSSTFNGAQFAGFGPNNGGSATCQGINPSGAAMTMNTSLTCCRMPAH